MKKILFTIFVITCKLYVQNTVEITEKSHTLLYDELQSRYWQRFFEKFIFPTPETEWLENKTTGQFCVVSNVCLMVIEPVEM